MNFVMMLAVLAMTLSATVQAKSSPVIAPAPKCQEEFWTLTSHSTQMLTSCMPGEPLQRIWTSRVFPKLGSQEYPVEVWQGSYGRTLLVTQTYSRRLVDHCNSTIIDLGPISVAQRKTVEFKIDNPNLNDAVAASYELVPMTSEEAAVALDRALQACLAWTPAEN